MLVSSACALLSESTKQKIVHEQCQRLGKEVAGSLESLLTDHAYVKSLWQRLARPERAACQLFLQRARRGFLSKKEWERVSRPQQTYYALGLTGLRRLGFAFTVRKHWSDVGYVIPQELREMLMGWIIGQIPDESVQWRQNGQNLSYYTINGRGLHLDLFAFLLSMAEGTVPLTRRRTIHRRWLSRVSPSISLQDGLVAHWFEQKFPDPLKKAYRASEAILLDISLRLGLIRVDAEEISLHEQTLAEWLALDPLRRENDLFRLVAAHYLAEDPWQEAFAFAMRSYGHGEWIPVELLLEQIRGSGFEMPENAHDVILREWLHPLLGFGWIRLGQDGQQLCWRWNPLHHSAAPAVRWYVEPTGEIICPPDVPLDRLWSLARLGTVRFEPELVRCTLHPQKVQSCAARDPQAEQGILALLSSGCPYPLPQHVEKLVTEWVGQTRQIRFEPWIRVRLSDPRLLAEWREIPALRPFLGEVVSATDFLIPQQQQQELEKLLKSLGYEPQLPEPGSKPGRTHELSVASEGTHTGLFAAKSHWEGYRVENVFPDRYEGLPQLQQLPKMWTQHFQSYHPQTMRDLFRRAQELQLAVQLETDTNRRCEGVPLQVEVEMGFWYITMEKGRKREKIRLDDVRRVRLILPDYS